MSKPADESSNAQTPEEMRVEAQHLLDEIKKFWELAEKHAKETEDIKRRADSEALYASNAKTACEGHSTAIAGLKGTAEADLNSIATNKQKADELLAAATVAKAKIDGDRDKVTEARTKIEGASGQLLDAAARSVEPLKEVETARETVKALSRETTDLRDEAIQARNKIEKAQEEVEQFSTSAGGFVTKITKDHSTGSGLSTEISELAAAAKVDRDALAEVLEHLKSSHETATSHEKRLEELEAKLKKVVADAEGLLPGFTSTSLASSFNKQRDRFKNSQKWWIITFGACIALLLMVSGPSFWRATFDKATTQGWEEIFRGLAARLPIVIPVVWLAIYAGRNYMLSLRLEEDYAYKEAISIAFQGYKREMSAIPAGDAENPSPLATLCGNILKAVAERPGRIYDGKQQDITPFNEAKQATRELSKKTIATAP